MPRKKEFLIPWSAVMLGCVGGKYYFSSKRGSFLRNLNFTVFLHRAHTPKENLSPPHPPPPHTHTLEISSEQRFFPALPPLPQPGTGTTPRTLFPTQGPSCPFGLDFESQRLWKKDCKEQAAHLPLHPLPPTTAVSQEVAPHTDGRAGNSNPLSFIGAGTHPPHPSWGIAEPPKAQEVAARITRT